MKSTLNQSNRARQPQRIAGFSLVEMMIALVLGLLLSAGIVTLFSGTSKTNRVQNGLANLQENGRYAMSRIENDLRKLGGQFRMNTSGQAFLETTNGPVYPGIGPSMNVTGFTFPDGTGGAPSGWPSDKVYALSPRYFLQGYDCSSGTCSPTVPTAVAPAEGTVVGSRITGTDVLTLRHQRGTGWPYSVTGTGTGTVITLAPKWTVPADCTQGGDDCVNIVSNDLVLLSDCSGPTVFQVTRTGNTLTPTALRDVNQLKPSPGSDSCDPRVFNFSRDMVTVSYWLELARDDNVTGRLIPALMRAENGNPGQEVVRGVERLDFLYGVQLKNGGTRYVTGGDSDADSVGALSTSTNCTDQPSGLTALEGGCLWRSVTSIEVHALLNTVDNINDLSGIDTAYRYKTSTPAAPTGTTMPLTGLLAGRMMRREFVVLVSVRNFNS